MSSFTKQHIRRHHTLHTAVRLDQLFLISRRSTNICVFRYSPERDQEKDEEANCDTYFFSRRGDGCCWSRESETMMVLGDRDLLLILAFFTIGESSGN